MVEPIRSETEVRYEMTFMTYLKFDGTELPLPTSYEVTMTDVEADSGGET